MMRVIFIVWVVVAITVVYAEVNATGNFNGNVTKIRGNDVSSEDIPDDYQDEDPNATISRSKRKGADYEYYTNPNEEPAPPRHLLFTFIMYSGVACIVIEMLVTLYGPALRDSPLRWHTLNYCCWNCFQIIIYANCAEESPFEKFLKNDYITDNCTKIQQMTLAIYYHSMFFVILAEILLHFFPSTKNLRVMKYYVWIPLLFTLDMALFLAYSSQPWQWYYTGLIPLDVYQAGVTVINYLFMAICFIAALCAIGQWCYYYCQYSARPDGQTYKRFMEMLNFLLFFVYYIVITVFHAPRNGVAMGQFLSKYLYEYLKILIDLILPIVTTMLTIQDFFAGLIPIAEFFATFLCLQIYRTQLLQCLSCGQNMHKPRPLTRPILPIESPKRLARTSVSLENGEIVRPSASEIKIATGGFFKNDVAPCPPTPDKQSSSTTSTTT